MLGSDYFGSEKNSGEKKVSIRFKKIRYKVDAGTVLFQTKHKAYIFTIATVWNEIKIIFE